LTNKRKHQTVMVNSITQSNRVGIITYLCPWRQQ